MSSFVWPKIAPGKSAAFIGPKGSGKTTLMKALLLTRRNVLVFDSKLDEDWSMIGERISIRDVRRIRGGRFVLSIPPDFIRDPDVQSDLFFDIYQAGHRCIAIDEMTNYDNTFGLKIIAVQGRSRKCDLWVCSQRVHSIPLYSFSEANHIFVFGLALEEDQDRIRKATGLPRNAIPWAELIGDPHAFVHLCAGKVSDIVKLSPESAKRLEG